MTLSFDFNRLKPSVSFNLTERNSDYEISDSQNDSDELELPRKKLKTKYAASKSFSAGDGILPKNRKASKFVSSKSEEKISNGTFDEVCHKSMKIHCTIVKLQIKVKPEDQKWQMEENPQRRHYQ